MNTTKIFATFAIALLIASCVQSLHPLYTDKELVFEPRLVGTWKGEGGNLWIFLKSGDKAYELIYTEKGSPAKFSAHLVKLGKFLFLDLFPQSPELKNDLQQAHLLNVHTFSRLWLEDDTLRLAMLEQDWLKKMITQKKIQIKHERLGDGIVLTASTKDLQKLALNYANNSDAFPIPKTWLTRQK